MIGALVSVISLNLTLSLVSNGVVAYTLPVTGATATTPIHLTCAGHPIPPQRKAHGVVSGVSGTTEANGLWELSYVDPNTVSLATYTPQGTPVSSVGVNAYVSGGNVQIAFPDFRILLGRRWIATSGNVASPRIVFVPTDGRKWGFEPYGGVGGVGTVPPSRGTVEQQAEKLQPQEVTEFTTFEVYVTGSASPPDPDFGDFDATQALVSALYTVLFDAITPPRAQVLRESWPSQRPESGTQTQRGQQWMGIIEFQQPVIRNALQFVPIGTVLQETIEPINPGSTDPVVLVIS